jgi:gas vesicle protein
MTTLAYLSRHIWVKGELTEPKLSLIFSPPSGSLTLVLALCDYNGVKVTDDYQTTIPSGTVSKTIELGDYLNAQQAIKGFGSGVYVIIAKIRETNEVFALPLIVSLGAVYSPSIPDKQFLQYYTVFDTVVGVYYNIPPTIDYIPSDPKFLVYAYLHKGNKGRLIGLDLYGNIEFDTDYHQLALITLTLKFNSVRNMITHMLGHNYGLTRNVILNVLDAINRGDYNTALTLLRPYYMITFIGRMLTVEFDTTKYEIRIKTQVYLGQWDWSKVLGWGAIGCGVGMIATAAITGLTAGVGSITAPILLMGCGIGGVIGTGVGVLQSASSDKPETVIIYKIKLEDEGEKAKKTNQQYYTSASELLNAWLQQGKITQDDYNQMIAILNSWKTAMDSAIDDIVNLAKTGIEEAYKNGYNNGYKKGVEESKTWIIGAGVGGFVLGMALGRR